MTDQKTQHASGESALNDGLGIHPSHDMTDWENTIITISCTPRFGRIRECRQCGGEHAETVAGKAIHDGLRYECI